MSNLLLSILIYAIPANVIAVGIMFYGKRSGLNWHPIEYLLVYFPWALMQAMAVFIFGNLDAALKGTGFTDDMLVLFSVVAGVLGGVSLLPRLFFDQDKIHRVLVSSLSSGILATVYMKFVLLVAVFFASPN